ncbi:MAG: hypothetical protein AAF191_10550, partial [Verrucomicrobiota bacterium]
MITPATRTLLHKAARSKHPLHQGKEHKTFLSYVPEFQRFVAILAYHRELYADSTVVTRFLDQISKVQTRYASGIAYPLAGDYSEGRLFLIQQVLPGHSLEDLIRDRRHLSPASVLLVGRLVAERLHFVADHYDLHPSLAPSQVVLFRQSGQDWTAGFTDYDLRSVRQSWDETGERQTVDDFVALLYYLRTGAPLPEEGITEDSLPGVLEKVGPELAPVFQTIFPAESWMRVETLDHLIEVLQDHAPQGADAQPSDLLQEPPLSPAFSRWMPPTTELTDRYEYQVRHAELDFPFTLEAWDQLRECQNLVHVFPPLEACAPAIQAIAKECIDFGPEGRKDAPLRMPVDAVLSDPSCCLFAEREPSGWTLAGLLRERDSLRLEEAIYLIERIRDALPQFGTSELLASCYQPQNLYLQPHAKAAPADWWKDVSPAWPLKIRLRPLPTNLLFPTLAPDFAEFPQDHLERRKITQQFFEPKTSFASLCYTILRATQAPDQPLPSDFTPIFQRAFLSQATPDQLCRQILRSLRANAGKRSSSPPQDSSGA